MDGLPLRLLISAVVAGLTVPAILGGLGPLEADQASVRAQREIDRIVRSAQDFYLSGGGSEDLRIDLSGGFMARVESVRIGDAPGGPFAGTASYRVTGQAEAYLVLRPAVPLAGSDAPLVLGPSMQTVRVAYDGEGPVRLAVV